MEDDKEAPKPEKAMGKYAQLAQALVTDLLQCTEAAQAQQTPGHGGACYPFPLCSYRQGISHLVSFQCRA